MVIILALVFVVVFVVAIGKNNEEIPSGSTSEKNSSSMGLLGKSDSKEKPKDMLDDWAQRCDECGEYFEDCECNCEDDDCHNEGGW